MFQSNNTRVKRDPISIFKQIAQKEDQQKKQNFEDLLNQLRMFYPNELKIGVALKTGDCFFDSVAQGLNELNIKPGFHFTAKSLRKDCADYAGANKNPDQWVYNVIIGDAEEYFVPQKDPDGEVISENGYNKQDDIKSFFKYLEAIKNMATESSSPPIWGRLDIEGRMICAKYKVKIEVIELLEEPIKGSTENQYFIQSEQGEGDNVVRVVNYKMHFVPLLKNLEKDIEEAVEVSREEVYGLINCNIPFSVKDVGNCDLQEGIEESLQVPVQFNQDFFVASDIYHRLNQVIFDSDDSGNSCVWSDIDNINRFMNQAVNDNQLAYYISPINFGYDTEEATRDLLKHVCKRQTRDGSILNSHYSTELDKPFIFVANTKSVFAKDSKGSDKESGGLHWVSCVLLPKKYTSVTGKEISSDKNRFFFFDSFAQKGIPKTIKEGLINGIEFMEVDIPLKLLPFCTGDEIAFNYTNHLTGQQINGNDCGWWAVYYALMTVYTGGIEFLEPLKGRKLSAKPLRSIMNLHESSELFDVGKHVTEQKSQIAAEELIKSYDNRVRLGSKTHVTWDRKFDISEMNREFFRSSAPELPLTILKGIPQLMTIFCAQFVKTFEKAIGIYSERLWDRNYGIGKYAQTSNRLIDFIDGSEPSQAVWCKPFAKVLKCLSSTIGRFTQKQRVEKLSSLLHAYDCDTKKARGVLIKSAMSIFLVFEEQFSLLADKEPNQLYNAIDDIAEDMVERIIDYCVRYEKLVFSVENNQYGVLLGHPKKHISSSTLLPNLSSGHKTYVNTIKFVGDTGIKVGDDYYIPQPTFITKRGFQDHDYSYRLLFDWEKDLKKIEDDKLYLPYLGNACYRKVELCEEKKYKHSITEAICMEYSSDIYSTINSSNWELTGDLQRLVKGFSSLSIEGLSHCSRTLADLQEVYEVDHVLLQDLHQKTDKVYEFLFHPFSEQRQKISLAKLFPFRRALTLFTVQLLSMDIDSLEKKMSYFTREFLSSFLSSTESIFTILQPLLFLLNGFSKDFKGLSTPEIAKLKNFYRLVQSNPPGDLEGLLLESGIRIFQAFEKQFQLVTECKSNAKIIATLSSCAAFRVLDYICKKDDVQCLSCDLMIKGVVFGSSDESSSLFKYNGKDVSANEIYDRTAVFVSEKEIFSYYKDLITEYGIRLPFSFEKGESKSLPKFCNVFTLSVDESFLQQDYKGSYHLAEINFADEIKLIIGEIEAAKSSEKGDIENLRKVVSAGFKEVKDCIKGMRYDGEGRHDDGGGGPGGTGGHDDGGGGPGGTGGHDDGGGGPGGTGGHDDGGGGPGGTGGHDDGGGGPGDDIDSTLSLSGNGVLGPDKRKSPTTLKRKLVNDLPTVYSKKRLRYTSQKDRKILQDLFGVDPYDEIESLLRGETRKDLPTLFLSNDGKNPAHWAVLLQDAQVLSEILQRHPFLARLADQDGLNPTYLAAEVDDPVLLNLLLESQTDIHTKDIDSNEILADIFFHSISFGSLKTLRFLVNKFPGLINITDKDGMGPVHRAAVLSDPLECEFDPIDFLIKEGADCKKADKRGATPLHYAANCRSLRVVELLVDNFASLNISDKNGKTPLHYAAEGNKLDVVKFLVEQGAEIDAVCRDGKTPLHYTVEGNKIDVVKFLVEQGAEIDAVCRDGKTPLHYAVEDNELCIVKFLIKRGARVSTFDRYSLNPLHLSIASDSFEVSVFLHNIYSGSYHDEHGFTSLHLSVIFKRHELIVYLMSKCPMLVATPDKYGSTPFFLFVTLHGNGRFLADLATIAYGGGTVVSSLDYAAMSGELDAMFLLCKSKDDQKLSDWCDISPLHHAAVAGRLDIIKFMQKKGFCLDLPSRNSNTALHFASASGHLDVVKFLVQKRCSLNVANIYGLIPLDSAAINGEWNIVKFLVEVGASLNVVDSIGYTPYDDASITGKVKVGEFLHKRSVTPHPIQENPDSRSSSKAQEACYRPGSSFNDPKISQPINNRYYTTS
ncbi:ankyrin repeat domain-containing protein [Wolbachia endosymbiont (group A) of Ophion costatus]|uniref:ankyrin repeat domain-containing protein n=1 Tax=Wolbachia endosymbiont (group A) of Ophion costatus TaxID=3066209 RepID=UPI0030D07FC2